jgi:hypothetical protein
MEDILKETEVKESLLKKRIFSTDEAFSSIKNSLRMTEESQQLR